MNVVGNCSFLSTLLGPYHQSIDFCFHVGNVATAYNIILLGILVVLSPFVGAVGILCYVIPRNQTGVSIAFRCTVESNCGGCLQFNMTA